MPALMLLLLAGDGESIEALRDLAAEDVDWTPEDWWPDREELMVELATAIKRVILDLAKVDTSSLSDRLTRTLDAGPGDPDVAALVDGLASGGFALLAYQRRWLPALADDLAGLAVEGQDDTGPDWRPAANASGWSVDSGRASVRYRPTGHSDGLLKAWIDTLAAHADADLETDDAPDDAAFRRRLRTRMFEGSISKGFLYSTCLRCHSVDENAGSYRVNWLSAGRESRAPGYFKFDHDPHLTILGETGACHSCHEMPEESSEDALASGMLPHRKDQCVDCHAPGRANADCLNCHVYHFSRP